MDFEEWLKKHKNKIPKYMRDTEGGRNALKLCFCGGAAELFVQIKTKGEIDGLQNEQ
jgi:hypothetical protein